MVTPEDRARNIILSFRHHIDYGKVTLYATGDNALREVMDAIAAQIEEAVAEEQRRAKVAGRVG